ncbi:MAG: PAS domain S-box protein [Clostridiales bacterium]|nr:PAS domain S-box protein [Clostridiales bacterium]
MPELSEIFENDPVSADLKSIRELSLKLDKEKKKLQNIIESTGIGTWEWDIESDRMEFNQRWAEIIGYGLDELQPATLKTWMNFVHPNDMEILLKVLKRHFKKEMAFFAFESRMKHKNGQWIWTLSKGSVTDWDDDGKPLRISGIHSDITDRKLAEESLATSERRYNIALEGAEVGTWDLDLLTGQMYYSPVFWQILGYTEAVTANDLGHWEKTWHPDDEQRIRKTLSDLIKGKTEKFEVEHRIQHKNGEWRWVVTRGTVLRDSAGNALRAAGTLFDVTDLKNEQQKNLDLRSIIDTIPALIWSALPDGSLDYSNKSWLDYTGFTIDQGLGKQWTKALHPEDNDSTLELWRKSIKTGEPYKVEQRLSDAKGRYRWFLTRALPMKDSYGNIQKWYGANIDITDLKQAEDSLERERELLRTTLFSIDEGIFATDTSGKIVLMNKSAEKHTGWTMAEAIGKEFSEVFCLIDMTSKLVFANPVKEVFEAGGSVTSPENLGLKSRNGSEMRIAGGASPIKASNGETTGIVVYYRDITLEYQQEKEIEGFLEVNLDMLCVIDEAGNFFKVNRKFEEVLGYSTVELEGRSFMEFVHAEDTDATRKAIEEISQDGILKNYSTRYRCKDGSYKHIEWHSQTGSGKFSYSSARDITEKILLEEQLRKIAIKDDLTGLYNRYYLETTINKHIEHSDRYGEPLSLVLIDLDKFKDVNDSWGHPTGDDLLKYTSQKILASARASDIVIRFGGEEFIVLMPQTTIKGAVEAAEKLRAALEENPHPVAGRQTASMGVAEHLRSESFRNLYRRVDQALYRAKLGGRNKVEASDPAEFLPAYTLQLEWRKEWESGSDEIDKQHRELLALANRLFTMSVTGSGRQELTGQLDQLLIHISNHFKAEEKILASLSYPELKVHSAIHARLIVKAGRLRTSYSAEEVTPLAFFSFIIDDVLLEHMLEADALFFPYTRNHQCPEQVVPLDSSPPLR